LGIVSTVPTHVIVIFCTINFKLPFFRKTIYYYAVLIAHV